MATIRIEIGVNRSMHPILSFPPLEKGGQGGFLSRNKTKSPSVPLFQRGIQLLLPFSKQLTGRGTFAVVLLVILTVPSYVRAQNLPAGEKQKIEALIKHLGDLKEANFVRNGTAYEPATAVRFLRGKWNANSADVKSARDFIDKVASSSGTTGKPYLLRFKDGNEIPSRQFLLAELKKIET